MANEQFAEQKDSKLKHGTLLPRLEPLLLILLFIGMFYYITWLNKNKKGTEPVLQALTLSLYNEHIGDFLMRFHFVEDLFSKHNEKSKTDFNKLYDLGWMKYKESLKLLDATLKYKQLSVTEIDKLTKAKSRLVCNMAVWDQDNYQEQCLYFGKQISLSGPAKTQALINFLNSTGWEKEAKETRDKITKESLFRIMILSIAGVFFLTVFIFGLIILFCSPFFLNRFFPSSNNINPASWSLKDGFLLILYGFVIMAFPILLQSAIPNIAIYIRAFGQVPAIVSLHFIQLFLFVTGVYVYLQFKCLKLQTTGLSFPGFKKLFFAWGSGYMGMVPLVVVSGLISHALLPQEKMSSNPILYVLLSNEAILNRFLLGLLLTVYAPLMEEILFRGILYRTLRIKFTPFLAISLSAFTFAFLHNDPLGFFPIFSIGFALAFVAERSGTLLPGMLIHSLWNAGPFWITILIS